MVNLSGPRPHGPPPSQTVLGAPPVSGSTTCGIGSGLALSVFGLNLVGFLHALFQFLLGLADRPGELRQLCTAEQEQGDDQNNEEFRSTKCKRNVHVPHCSGVRVICTGGMIPTRETRR